MDIKNKVLINKESNTYEYTLFCRKCRRTISATQVEKNQIELSRLKCECSIPVMPDVPRGTITPEPLIEAKPIKISTPNKSHKKKKGKR